MPVKNDKPYSKEFDSVGLTRIYTSIQVVTQSNVKGIVEQALGTFFANRERIKYLWYYYKGNQPILYREKTIRDDVKNCIVENHAYEFVKFKVGQTYGEPLQVVARTDDEKISAAVDKFSDYLKDAHKHARDIKAGEWQSATGIAFKAAQFAPEGAKIPFRITCPSPLCTFVVYNDDTEEPILAVQERYDEKMNLYYQCYSETNECKIKDNKVTDWKLHAYGGIPIVEIPNDSECISDIALVADLLDATNNMQSNRMDSVEQFVQSWIKFVNCEVDEETFQKMKMDGALVVKSINKDNKSDVDIMTQELNQTESQVAKEDLLENALTILAIPNKQSNTGGDTQGAVELRNGWDFSKSRARMKDALVVEAEQRLNKVLLNIIRIRKGADDCPISIYDFDINVQHSPLDNLIIKCQALEYLLKSGIHPLVAMKTCGLWGDVEKVFIQSKPYLDRLYRKVDASGVDVEYETKKATLFVQLLNAGADPAEAAEKAGLSIDTTGSNFQKWNYDDEKAQDE